MPSPLPPRAGDRPRTTPTNPHTQLDQQPNDPALAEELARRVFALSGVVERPSAISVPGARALTLAAGEPVGPPEAFLIDREFAHLHPSPDHSLHAMRSHRGRQRGRRRRLGRGPPRRAHGPHPTDGGHALRAP